MRRIFLGGVMLAILGIGFPLLADESDSSFARWEKAISAFEKQDEQNPPPKGATLFVGSSSIRMWKLDKFFPDRGVINRGFGGSEIADSVHFADRIILKHRPKTIVFYAGDNDIARKKSPGKVAEDFQKFVKIIRKDLPKTKIVFIAIKPSLARWKLAEPMQKANRLIQKECQKHDRLAFVDVWKPMLGDDGRPRRDLFIKDGLHLSEAGYTLWTSLVRPHLASDTDG